jgi:hypothetical protein
MRRFFQTEATATAFIITETRTQTGLSVTRQQAWDRARAQAAPVIFVGTNGIRRNLGVAFSAEIFERTMFAGHVSYELSMTDGHYAPEPAEVWIAELRKFPRTSYNDAAPEVLAALGKYIATLGA